MLEIIGKRIQANYGDDELRLLKSFNDDELSAYIDFYNKNKKHGVTLKPSEYKRTEGHGKRMYRIKEYFGSKEFEMFLSFDEYFKEFYLRYFRSKVREKKPPSIWYQMQIRRDEKRINKSKQKLDNEKAKTQSVEAIVEKFLNLLRERISEDDAKMYFEMFDRMQHASYQYF